MLGVVGDIGVGGEDLDAEAELKLEMLLIYVLGVQD